MTKKDVKSLIKYFLAIQEHKIAIEKHETKIERIKQKQNFLLESCDHVTPSGKSAFDHLNKCKFCRKEA